MRKVISILLICVLGLLSVNQLEVKAIGGCQTSEQDHQEYLKYFKYNALKLNNNDTISYKRCSDYSNGAYFTFDMNNDGYVQITNQKTLNSNGYYGDTYYIVLDLKGKYIGSYSSKDEMDNLNYTDQFILGLGVGKYILYIVHSEDDNNIEYSNKVTLNMVEATNFEKENLIEYDSDYGEYYDKVNELKLNVPFTGTLGSKQNISMKLNGLIESNKNDNDNFILYLNKPSKVRVTIERDWNLYPIVIPEVVFDDTDYDYYALYTPGDNEDYNLIERNNTPKDSKGNIYNDYVLPIGNTIIQFNNYTYSGAKYTIKVDLAPYSTFTSFKVNTIHNASTTLTGKSVAGSVVKAYKGTTYLGQATVNASGNYSMTIPKQIAGTTITLKNSKFWYKEYVTSTKVLYYQSTFSANDINYNSTTVTGKGSKDSQVSVYAGTKLLGSAKVDASGNYKVIIPKQKANSYVQVKISKPNFAGRQITLKV